MKLSEIKVHLENQLEFHLSHELPDHPFKDVYLYSVLPPGKLFRPFLAISVVSDFAQDGKHFSLNSPHSYLCSALEIHHAYTLVHDDLPCMDNDDLRRGRLTVHKKFSEWQALLAGDGLLNISYRLLSKINSPKLPSLLKMFSWALGAKGLIQGQALDLSGEMKNDFETLVLTHKLKTARLIQVSLCGSYLLIEHKKETQFSETRTFIDLFKFGHYLGICFQLLDDLTELGSKDLSEHERAINPWFYFPEESLHLLDKGLEVIKTLSEKHQTHALNLVLKDYFAKIHSILNENIETVAAHQKKTPRDLVPMMSRLEKLSEY